MVNASLLVIQRRWSYLVAWMRVYCRTGCGLSWSGGFQVKGRCYVRWWKSRLFTRWSVFAMRDNWSANQYSEAISIWQVLQKVKGKHWSLEFSITLKSMLPIAFVEIDVFHNVIIYINELMLNVFEQVYLLVSAFLLSRHRDRSSSRNWNSLNGSSRSLILLLNRDAWKDNK